MKKLLIFIILVALIVIVWVFAKKNTTVVPPTVTQPTDTVPATSNESSTMNAAPSSATNTQSTQPVSLKKDQTVSIANFAFGPQTITIPVGGTVTWTQQDSVPHSVVANDGSFSSTTLSKGQTYSHTFTAAGTYAYHCGIHPMMTAKIIVQ